MEYARKVQLGAVIGVKAKYVAEDAAAAPNLASLRAMYRRRRTLFERLMRHSTFGSVSPEHARLERGLRATVDSPDDLLATSLGATKAIRTFVGAAATSLAISF